MKGGNMKTLVIVCVMSLLAGLGATATFAEDIVPIATGEWPPYTSEKFEGYGVCTEVVSAIMQEMGLKPKYTFYPWKRAEMMVLVGRVFGAFPYAITTERQQEFDFSEMIIENKTVFFYLKARFPTPPKWNTLENLRVYRIGGVVGASYISAFEKAGLNFELVALEEQNVRKLESNRIDLMITDEAVGWQLIQQLYPSGRDGFATLDKPLITGNSHLMVSRTFPNHAQLLTQFNQALIRIKESGKYQAILAKYGLQKP
jgi:polar amino acid transport system substrate-binding protein